MSLMEDAQKRDSALDRELAVLMGDINKLANRPDVSQKTRIALTLAYTELAGERNLISRRWN